MMQHKMEVKTQKMEFTECGKVDVKKKEWD